MYRSQNVLQAFLLGVWVWESLKWSDPWTSLSRRPGHDFTQEALQRQEDLELELKAWDACRSHLCGARLVDPCCMFMAAAYPPMVCCMLELAMSRSFKALCWHNLKRVGWRVKAGRKNCGRPWRNSFLFFFTDPFHNLGSNRIQDAFELKLVKQKVEYDMRL